MIFDCSTTLIWAWSMPKADASTLGIADAVDTTSAASADAAEPSFVTTTAVCTSLWPTVALTAASSTPSALATLEVSTVGGAMSSVDDVLSSFFVSNEALPEDSRRREESAAVTSHAGGTERPQSCDCSAAAISASVMPAGMVTSILATSTATTLTTVLLSVVASSPPTAALERASTRSATL